MKPCCLHDTICRRALLIFKPVFKRVSHRCLRTLFAWKIKAKIVVSLNSSILSCLTKIYVRQKLYHKRFNPRLTMGDGYTPSRNLNYILCGYFEEKMGVPPFRWGKISLQRWRVRGWLPPEKILSHHFEKILLAIQMKPIVMLESPFSFIISQNLVKF